MFNPVDIHKVFEKETITQAQKLVNTIYLDEKVVSYIISLVFATRTPSDYSLDSLTHLIEHGASPRATLALVHAAKAYAFLKRRHFVIPDDVKIVAPAILRHRLRTTYVAQADQITTDEVGKKILHTLPSP